MKNACRVRGISGPLTVFSANDASELPIESSPQAVGAMIVMTNVAFHIKVHGLFISGLDAVAKADNAPGSFLIICCDITVGAICRCYIISIEEFVEQGRLEITFAVKFRVKVLYEVKAEAPHEAPAVVRGEGNPLGIHGINPSEVRNLDLGLRNDAPVF